MDKLIDWVARLFGYSLIALSVFVAAETLSRKLFNFSFEGADELGGYVLAVGSSLAFSVALTERAHIRIDLLYQFFPTSLQAFFNWLSVFGLAAMAVFLVWVGWPVIRDTLDYGSTAPTPWATPLIYPQVVWYGALAVFAVVAVTTFVRATIMVIGRRFDSLNAEFHPKGAIEELQDEIADLQSR